MIYHTKAEDWLKTLLDNSKDGCISDFPYGLKFMGKKWDYDLPSVEALTELYRVLKPGAFVLGFSSSRTYHRLAVRLEDIGFELRDCIMWLYGSGFPKSLDISKAFAKAGKEHIVELWKGWGTCLKPAYEPIVVAMKPLDGTFIQNAESHGVAGLNIEECRIDYQNDTDKNTACAERPKMYDRGEVFKGSFQDRTVRGNPEGRFPSNVILSENAASELDQQTGILKSGAKKPTDNRNYGEHIPNNVLGKYTIIPCDYPASEGGASRFFYVAKASPADRNYGLPNGNKHPTVKPIKLARYLARLIKTPFPNAKYINPYSGSGTEMIGFILEGMSVEGCEMEERSFNDAQLRIAQAHKDYNIEKQPTLF